MARTNRTAAKAALQLLLPTHGYADITFTADDKFTATTPDGAEIAAVIASRIIGYATNESDVISLAPTKRVTFDRYFATDFPTDISQRMLFVADIDSDMTRIRIVGFDYDEIDMMICMNDAVSSKTNGGIAFNFARFDEMRADAVESGIVTIGD